MILLTNYIRSITVGSQTNTTKIPSFPITIYNLQSTNSTCYSFIHTESHSSTFKITSGLFIEETVNCPDKLKMLCLLCNVQSKRSDVNVNVDTIFVRRENCQIITLEIQKKISKQGR